jgi:hypothetical protein
MSITIGLLTLIGVQAVPSFEVGYAQVDITPPLGGSMPGYFHDRLSTGVLDPLLAKVLVLRQRETTLAIVACDLIGLEAPEVQKIRAAIGDRTGIPADHILVHSTHTHTGAALPDRFTSDAEELSPDFHIGQVNREWLDNLPTRIATCVAEAVAKCAPQTSIRLATGTQDKVAFIRRYLMRDGSIRTNPGRGNPDIVRPVGTIDPKIRILCFEPAKVLLVNYALHLDCIGGTQHSADFPYHLTEAIRESMGAEWNVVFLNGCCGNINHIDVKNVGQKSGYEESRRIGRELAGATVQALKTSEFLEIDSLDARTRVVGCKLREIPPEVRDQAAREIQEGVDFAKKNFNEPHVAAAYVLSRTRDRTHPAEVMAMRIGPVGLVGLPAEVFVEISKQIQTSSPLDPTLVCELANGCMGYVPHYVGYAEGGYEANYISARYAPGTGEEWAAAAIGLCREMRP